MPDCEHENAEFDINQNIMEDSSVRYLEISGHCVDCGRKYKFQCEQIGSSPFFPTVSIDQESIQLPVLMDGDSFEGSLISMTGPKVVLQKNGEN